MDNSNEMVMEMMVVPDRLQQILVHVDAAMHDI